MDLTEVGEGGHLDSNGKHVPDIETQVDHYKLTQVEEPDGKGAAV